MAKQVDPKLAAACVDKYQELYQSDDLITIQDAFTSSISFTVGGLKSFLAGYADDEIIKIMPGVYTDEFAKAYGTKAGRMTTFLYPVTAGNDEELRDDPPPPVPDLTFDPYNAGTLEP